jgi:ATP synthase F1 delta subunit
LHEYNGYGNERNKLKYSCKYKTLSEQYNVSLKSDNENVIAKRYAKAFCGAGISEQQMNEFLDVANLLVSDVLFLRLLSVSKGKTSKDKKNTTEWMRDLTMQLKLSQKVSHFLMLIAFKNRLIYLNAIVKAVQDIVNQKADRDFVTLRSAKPLTDADLENIKQEIKSRINFEPILDIVIDPKLLDGYVVRTRSIMIDNSLKKRIEKLHNTMKGVA